MTKKDLKSGMIVELRNGERYLVFTDCETRNYGKQDFCLIRAGELIASTEFNDDLTCTNSQTKYDIVKVSGLFVGRKTLEMQYTDIIWERPVTETITIGSVKYDKAEVEEAIKNLKTVN